MRPAALHFEQGSLVLGLPTWLRLPPMSSAPLPSMAARAVLSTHPRLAAKPLGFILTA